MALLVHFSIKQKTTCFNVLAATVTPIYIVSLSPNSMINTRFAIQSGTNIPIIDLKGAICRTLYINNNNK